MVFDDLIMMTRPFWWVSMSRRARVWDPPHSEALVDNKLDVLKKPKYPTVRAALYI